MGTFARKFLSGLAFSVCLTGAANAADILPPIVEERVVSVAGGWYLRGDIGYDIQKTVEFSHTGVTAASGAFIDHSIDRSGSLGVGVGYEFNDWFRADVTAEFLSARVKKAEEARAEAEGSAVDDAVKLLADLVALGDEIGIPLTSRAPAP